MLRSIQAVAYSMQVQADRLNIAANNVANINTRAYKKDVVNVKSFDDVLTNALQYNSGDLVNTVGPISLGSSIDKRLVSFEQGYLEQTGFNTDLAIRGDGFFTVETPQGIQYTRAGNFNLDQNGYLVTQEGFYVLGDKGRVQIPNRKLKADLQGNIYDIKANGDTVGIDKIRLTYFNDKNLLLKSNNGYYINQNPTNVSADGESDILNEYIENSNVNVEEETQDMLEAKRNYESCQQVIRMIDDTAGKAASEIGKL